MLVLLPVGNYASAQDKISIDVKKESLKNVLNIIQSQGKYRFLYSNDDVNPIFVESIKFKNASITEALNAVLKPTSLTYQIGSDNIIYIKKVKQETVVKKEKPKITGKVTDTKKQPLPGVSVMIKGTQTGVATDLDGNFELSVENPQNATIQFTFIGMVKKDVVYKGQLPLIVVLEDDALEMKELVVNGIITRKKESFTGSSSTYNVEDLKMIGNTNILMSLKSMDPSFAIIENNNFGSDPNRLPDIEIRGKSSVIGLTEQYGTDPNQPLFILDGFESTLAVISDLSMDRVQSITILKDASATAIYGSKASNGVIVVETKRPESGRLKVNYNGNFALSFADLSDYNLMNSFEKLTFERLSGNYGTIDKVTGNIVDENREILYYNNMKEVERGVDTYWLNVPLRFATNHKHTLFVEGGDDHMRYGIGMSYGKTEGVMKYSDRDVLNENIRLMYRTGKISFTNTFNFDYTKVGKETIPFSSFSRANPYFRKTDDNGVPSMLLGSNTSLYNPYYDMLNNNFNRSSTAAITNNFEIEWKMMEELRLRSRVGISKSGTKGDIFLSPFNSQFAGLEAAKKGSYNETNTQSLKYDGDISLTYGKVFNENHLINAVTGIRFDENSSVYSGYGVVGFIDDEFCNPAFAIGYPEKGKSTYTESKRRSLSYYLTGSYSFKNKYLIDVNYRMDGASVFGADKQFSNTWSVGLGWNLQHEEFFKKIKAIQLFKIRGSIGNPGNQNFSDYISMRIYSYNNETSNPFGVSTIVSNFGNRKLEWQKTLDANIGFDLATLDNKLRITYDYFYKNTNPLLVYIGVPSSVGTTTVPRNLGGQITKGMTFVMNLTLLQNANFSWIGNVNLRHITSEYRDIDQSLDIFNQANKSKNLVRYYNGASPTDLWAVKSSGIDAATGREIFVDKQGYQTFVHSYDDEIVVGNTASDVEGVIGTTLRYKKLYISTTFSYRIGGQIFLQTLYDKVENISSTETYFNQDKRALYDRWKNPGDNAKYRSIAITNDVPISSRFVADNNVFKCESISVGYESTAKWLKNIGASSFNVKAYVNDIFRISTVKNERGLDYPFARSISMSMGIRF